MAYEQRDNSGTLGKNKRKTEDKHPDYSGECLIDGKPMWISGWLKTNGTTGEKFFSLAFNLKQQQSGGRGHQGTARDAGYTGDSRNAPPDDDVPF